MEPPVLQVPLEIAFHNIGKFAVGGAGNSCPGRRPRADLRPAHLVPGPHRPARQGSDRHYSSGCPHRARIPGRSDLVVSHEPEHLLRKYRHPDLHKAINEAFRIAERQLLDLKEQRDGRTKTSDHDTENQSLGQIAEITPKQDFGFLLTKEGGLLYFHRNALLSGDFDHLERGQEV
jgi:hypothetical protein